jgi:uncharacterized repeat protein (TIGR02543 family)
LPTDNLPFNKDTKEFLMKKRTVSLGILSKATAAVLVFGLLFTGCPTGDDDEDPTYTVTFNSDGGSAVPAKTGVAKWATITLPAAPTKAGFVFGGWFTEANGGGTEFTAATTISANITVIAKWTAVVAGPTKIEKIHVENGAFAVYKFELPSGAKYSDYGSITAKYWLDETNFAIAVRARAQGSYTEDQFADFGGGKVVGIDNGGADVNTNANYIVSQIGGNDQLLDVIIPGATAKTWVTATYLLDGSQKNAAYSHFPADDATGPFYYVVGLTKAGGDNVEYYAGDITLVHKTDATKNVVSTGSGFGDTTGFYQYKDRADPPYATRTVVTSVPQ